MSDHKLHSSLPRSPLRHRFPSIKARQATLDPLDDLEDAL